MNVVGYCRYSSDNQRSESIDAQVRAIQEYADKKKFNVISFYVDEAKTGTSDNREDFLRMIEDAQNTKFEAIIVHKLDRFSRDRYDSAVYKRILKKHNVKLFSVLENLDDSPESIILESVLEGMAEYYSKNLARETMKGMKENALKGLHNGGTPPLGYDVGSDKKLVINQKEAEAVTLIFEMYKNEKGYNSIVSHLNENGYKTKRGNYFSKNSIHDILVNEKYIGVYVFNQRLSKETGRVKKDDLDIIRIPNAIPPIINNDLFRDVQEKLSSTLKPRSNTKRDYLLVGRLICKECGGAYTGGGLVNGRSKKYVVYKCANRQRSGMCSNTTIRQDLIEPFVIESIRNNLFTDYAIKKLSAKVYDKYLSISKNKRYELTSLTVRSETIKRKIDNLLDLYLDGGITKEQFNNKTQLLKADLECVELKIRRLTFLENFQVTEDIVKSYLEHLRIVFESLDFHSLKEVINIFVKKIVVGKEEIELSLSLNSIFEKFNVPTADSSTHGGGDGN